MADDTMSREIGIAAYRDDYFSIDLYHYPDAGLYVVAGGATAAPDTETKDFAQAMRNFKQRVMYVTNAYQLNLEEEELMNAWRMHGLGGLLSFVQARID